MRWLSVDPGETTGWALWENDKLLDAGQDELVPFVDELAEDQDVVLSTSLEDFRRFGRIELLVIERFAIYPWKCKELEFDEVRTARGIGALEFIARHAGIRVVMQPATVKEPAQASGARELFQRPLHENRHANDAIMHGWYYIATELRGTRIDLPHASALVIDPDQPFAAGE